MKNKKPKYVNHCQHDETSFAGHVRGRDIYFYIKRIGEFGAHWHWCARTSSEPSDYNSGPYRAFFLGPIVFSEGVSETDQITTFQNERQIVGLFLGHIEALLSLEALRLETE